MLTNAYLLNVTIASRLVTIQSEVIRVAASPASRCTIKHIVVILMNVHQACTHASRMPLAKILLGCIIVPVSRGMLAMASIVQVRVWNLFQSYCRMLNVSQKLP